MSDDDTKLYLVTTKNIQYVLETTALAKPPKGAVEVTEEELEKMFDPTSDDEDFGSGMITPKPKRKR